MNDLEINIQELLDRMKKRIGDDAQTIAMLEATIEVYKLRLFEAEKKIAILQEMQEQQ